MSTRVHVSLTWHAGQRLLDTALFVEHVTYVVASGDRVALQLSDGSSVSFRGVVGMSMSIDSYDFREDSTNV